MTVFEEALLTRLSRIAAALEDLVALNLPPEPTPPETAPPDCLHLEKVDFGTTNGMPDWECTLCHYRPPV